MSEKQKWIEGFPVPRHWANIKGRDFDHEVTRVDPKDVWDFARDLREYSRGNYSVAHISYAVFFLSIAVAFAVGFLCALVVMR